MIKRYTHKASCTFTSVAVCVYRLNHTSVAVCVDRVVMCLMCGDEYKVDVPLSALLNHTSVDVCVLTGW